MALYQVTTQVAARLFTKCVYADITIGQNDVKLKFYRIACLKIFYIIA